MSAKTPIEVRVILIAVATIGLAACAGSDRDANEPMSAQRHEESAREHEREAESHDRRYDPAAERAGAASVQCADDGVPDPTSGTERIPVQKPCWTSVTNPTEHHRREADRHRERAREHRSTAADLLRAERESCAGLGEDAISHSPFFHRQDVAKVEPHEEGGDLRGVKVTFDKVEGLTADWMRKAIACHQARAAVMGYSRTFMPYCPLTAGPVSASVTETDTTIEVAIRTEDRGLARAILGRARDLTRPRGAE